MLLGAGLAHRPPDLEGACPLCIVLRDKGGRKHLEQRGRGWWGGGRDVATAAYEMRARFIKEFAGLPLGPVCPDFEQSSGAQQHGMRLTHGPKSWLKAP